MVVGDIAKSREGSSPGFDRLSNGEDERYVFSALKAF